MSIFLKKNEVIQGSKDDFIMRLFGHLDSYWYPVNVIGSETYDIFNAYGYQLASASAETRQTFLDLGIEGVRSAPVLGRSASKMYDNFGSVFQAEKLYFQDFEFFDESRVLQAYRQQLRFLIMAQIYGTTQAGIDNASRSLTGMRAHTINPLKEGFGWRLTTYYATVLEKTDEYVVIDNFIPRTGNVLYMADTSAFVVGEGCILSYSKLGSNTKLIGERDYYSGVRLTLFTSSEVYSDTSFQGVISNSINNTLRADIKDRIEFSNNFVFDKPGI